MSKRNRLCIKDTPMLYTAPEDSNTFKHLGYVITFKRYLSMQDKIRFLEEVKGYCIADGEYTPILFDFGVRMATLELYTNVTIPQGIKAATELALGSGLYEELMYHINKVDFDAMVAAAKEEIAILTAKNPFDGIIKYIENILEKYDSEIQQIDMKQLYKMLEIVTKSDDKRNVVELFKTMYRTED